MQRVKVRLVCVKCWMIWNPYTHFWSKVVRWIWYARVCLHLARYCTPMGCGSSYHVHADDDLALQWHEFRLLNQIIPAWYTSCANIKHSVVVHPFLSSVFDSSILTLFDADRHDWLLMALNLKKMKTVFTTLAYGDTAFQCMRHLGPYSSRRWYSQTAPEHFHVCVVGSGPGMSKAMPYIHLSMHLTSHLFSTKFWSWILYNPTFAQNYTKC